MNEYDMTILAIILIFVFYTIFVYYSPYIWGKDNFTNTYMNNTGNPGTVNFTNKNKNKKNKNKNMYTLRNYKNIETEFLSYGYPYLP
jgi:hypothetical protein